MDRPRVPAGSRNKTSSSCYALRQLSRVRCSTDLPDPPGAKINIAAVPLTTSVPLMTALGDHRRDFAGVARSTKWDAEPFLLMGILVRRSVMGLRSRPERQSSR